MMQTTEEHARRQAYDQLWLAYEAGGRPHGRDAAGAALWAYTQAIQFVSPTTADRIAAAVLAAGRMHAQDTGARPAHAAPQLRPLRRPRPQCDNCGTVATGSDPPGWLGIESLGRDARRGAASYHLFCSAACASTWLAPHSAEGACAPATLPAAALAARVTPAAPRRVVRVVRS